MYNVALKAQNRRSPMNTKTKENTKTEDSKQHYEHLAEGISSMKSGEIYTIEEAWQEIDQL